MGNYSLLLMPGVVPTEIFPVLSHPILCQLLRLAPLRQTHKCLLHTAPPPFWQSCPKSVSALACAYVCGMPGSRDRAPASACVLPLL